jgi:hypothetical protein
MRALQRIINIELVFYAISTAFFLKYFFNNKKYYVNLILFLFVMFIIVIDNKVEPNAIHRTQKSISQKRVNDLIDKMKLVTKDSIISYEPDTMLSAPHEYQIDAMLASQALSLTCINGYSARAPEGFHLYWATPNEETRKNWLKLRNSDFLKIKKIH